MKRIAVLEGLRGWLACWVMISHIMLYCAISIDHVKSPFWRYGVYIVANGRLAVWMFMILSGFINFYLLDMKRERPHVYLVRRFLRIYPVLAVLFVAALAINYMNLGTLTRISWANDQWIHIQYLVTQSAYKYLGWNCLVHGTMTLGLVPKWMWPHPSSTFLPDWSVGTEAQFYLLAPLLFYWINRSGALIWMGGLAIACLWSYTNKHIEFFENDNPSLILFKGHLFYVGIVSYLWYRRLVLKLENVGWTVASSYVVALLVIYLGSWDSSILLWIAVMGLTILVEKYPTDVILGRFAWPFTNRVAQYLGEISYSIYLFHWLAMMLVLRVVISFAPAISSSHAAYWMFPGVIALTIGVSHCLFRWVERPFVRLGKRLFHEED